MQHWLLLLVVAAAIAVAGYLYFLHRVRIDGWDRYVPMRQTQGPAELAVKRTLLSGAEAETRYEALFRYFLTGAVKYASPTRARIHYPGAPSGYGYRVNGLEGFARTGTLLAAWVRGGRSASVALQPDGPPVDLVAFLRQGLLAGTDPAGADYWGKMHDYGQRLVESADIARIVWMTREQIWDRLDAKSRRQIGDWLAQTQKVRTMHNNWLLFPVTAGLVLQALGYPASDAVERDYKRFKTYYAGNGWFVDKPHGIDYYNAWGDAYELYWISRISPAFDPDFVHQTLRESADLTAHLIAPQGFPIMGRSICYRTAVPVPVIAESFLDPAAPASGLARHAMDAVWRYFVANGSLQDGALTQGYFRSDLRLLDRYSGPGSCNWGLRSLVLAFLHPQGDRFWTAPAVPLPVEVADYHLDLKTLGWVVDGNKESGEITITIPANSRRQVPLQSYGLLTRVLESLVERPLRPDNHDAAYLQRQYGSRRPYLLQ